jgi:lysophospholipase L1-like esterase
MRLKRWLILSLALNVIALAALAVLCYETGVFRSAAWKMGVRSKPEVPRTSNQTSWDARYREMPRAPGDVVFAGDSLTVEAPYANYFSSVRTRGIGGETTAGLLARIDEVAREHPAKIFLMVGINDIAHDRSTDQLLDDYRRILERIRLRAPRARVYVESILPVNDARRDAPRQLGPRIPEINERLRTLAVGFDYTYIDLWPHFADDQGSLMPQYTTDGLHLSWDGAVTLVQALAPYVND